jgi:hypothetical protein
MYNRTPTKFQVKKLPYDYILLPNITKYNNDELVKSQVSSLFVIPAKAGIQLFKHVMDSRRSLPSKVLVGGGNDRLGDFLRSHHI